MAGLGIRILGGALTGLGDAALERAKQNREAALAAIKREQELTDQNTKFSQEKQLSDAKIAAEGGQIAGTSTDDEGNVTGYTRSGEVRPLGKVGKATKQPPLSDAGKIEQDYRDGRLSESEYKRAINKATHIGDGNGEPLVEISDGKGGTVYVPRSQAVGKPGKGSKMSAADVISPILAKVANGEDLTPGESKAWDMYTKMDPVKQAIARALAGDGGADNSLLAPDAAEPGGGQGPAKPATPTQQPPPQQKLPANVTADGARAQAKAAIAAGKDRAKIIDRLRSWGVDTSGL